PAVSILSNPYPMSTPKGPSGDMVLTPNPKLLNRRVGSNSRGFCQLLPPSKKVFIYSDWLTLSPSSPVPTKNALPNDETLAWVSLALGLYPCGVMENSSYPLSGSPYCVPPTENAWE